MDNENIEQQLKELYKQEQALYLEIERVREQIREIINYTNKNKAANYFTLAGGLYKASNNKTECVMEGGILLCGGRENE